jgi:hypothetical protein
MRALSVVWKLDVSETFTVAIFVDTFCSDKKISEIFFLKYFICTTMIVKSKLDHKNCQDFFEPLKCLKRRKIGTKCQENIQIMF